MTRCQIHLISRSKYRSRTVALAIFVITLLPIPAVQAQFRPSRSDGSPRTEMPQSTQPAQSSYPASPASSDYEASPPTRFGGSPRPYSSSQPYTPPQPSQSTSATQSVAAPAIATEFQRSFSSQPHPAVVQVIAPGKKSWGRQVDSLGTGSLVSVGDDYGLIVTNYHVIRDAVNPGADPSQSGQPIRVIFQDGSRHDAQLLEYDITWDLAALRIDRPDVAPIRIARTPPKPGDWLAIAGYGGKQYHLNPGQCTQYVSPNPDAPNEFVELSAIARDGDSGGPIFNSDGELAGVLFGSGRSSTTGAYCGRVAQFLGMSPDIPVQIVGVDPRSDSSGQLTLADCLETENLILIMFGILGVMMLLNAVLQRR